MYEVFEHTADLGLRIEGASLAELFAQAGRGLSEIIAGDLSQICTMEQRRISLKGAAPDDLMFDWLSELVYLFDAHRVLLVEFDVSVTNSGLDATARGEQFDESRHSLEHEVKAITYHELSVAEQDGRWIARVIVDI